MPATVTLKAPGGIALAIGERGATWLSCDVPVAGSGRRDVILRRAKTDEKSFLGSTIGRYANRIAHGRIRRDGREHQLALREGSPHHLHGGPGVFHARVWDVRQPSATQALFHLHSPAGEQGYPGAVDAHVTYRLVDAMTIEMEMRATTTAPTPLALTNHAYFNLDGAVGDVRRHALRVNASRYLPVDRELIPCGPPVTVDGTSFDFRTAKPIARDWLGDEQQRQCGGYDHAFLLDSGDAACELMSSAGDLRLAISTTLPALQFYSGQYLAGTQAPGGGTYPACAAIALEPGFLPDSPNHPEWPQASCWLQPGETFAHTIRYSFSR
jgi:aldose 1-epimerase